MLSLTKINTFILISFLLFACGLKKNLPADFTQSNYDINVNIQLAEVDHLGSIYILTDRNIIIKYDAENKEKYRYANKRSGQITHLDVTNPLKVLVFFDDFNRILILDNTLTEITETDLEISGFTDISAACISNDDQYWVYDPVQFKLFKINIRGIAILESSNVNDFNMSNVQISAIRESGNFVILMDKTKGFFIFDNLGQYIKRIDADEIKSFQFDGRSIFFYNSGGLQQFNLRLSESFTLRPFKNDDNDSLLFILNTFNGFIDVYKTGLNRISK